MRSWAFGEGRRKVWARLRHRGIPASNERIHRLMRQHGLQVPHRPGTAWARRRTMSPSPPRRRTGCGARTPPK
ncbi:IS3 family transposase [Desulfacinum hydrothermale]|uniref:IS3 family transposase n=1 Tax=Desulfacinum hydrothermale TaxID=109258 RepID=UPI0009FBE92E